MEDDEEAWSQWFEVQYALGQDAGRLLDKAGEGRSDQFRAALAASLIESLGEHLRRYLHLPSADVREGGEPS